jgi:hypothetical protein
MKQRTYPTAALSVVTSRVCAVLAFARKLDAIDEKVEKVSLPPNNGPIPWQRSYPLATVLSFSKYLSYLSSRAKPRDLRCAIRVPQIYRFTTNPEQAREEMVAIRPTRPGQPIRNTQRDSAPLYPTGRVPHVCTGVAGALHGLNKMGRSRPSAVFFRGQQSQTTKRNLNLPSRTMLSSFGTQTQRRQKS